MTRGCCVVPCNSECFVSTAVFRVIMQPTVVIPYHDHYHYSLRNRPEERISHLLRVGSLISCVLRKFLMNVLDEPVNECAASIFRVNVKFLDTKFSKRVSEVSCEFLLNVTWLG